MIYIMALLSQGAGAMTRSQGGNKRAKKNEVEVANLNVQLSNFLTRTKIQSHRVEFGAEVIVKTPVFGLT